MLFLSVLVAVPCSYGTVSLQTGLCWQGTSCVCTLGTLGLVLLPRLLFRDPSMVRTSHVVVNVQMFHECGHAMGRGVLFNVRTRNLTKALTFLCSNIH